MRPTLWQQLVLLRRQGVVHGRRALRPALAQHELLGGAVQRPGVAAPRREGLGPAHAPVLLHEVDRRRLNHELLVGGLRAGRRLALKEQAAEAGVDLDVQLLWRGVELHEPAEQGAAPLAHAAASAPAVLGLHAEDVAVAARQE
eukprot:CAMPEP_0176301144 /NCGR_PEP_ID=MMETSP0121_2-20121125/60702_1 /TAXON_ID=160619 /ORGANISM="Kryptoperidinium foliaceum, Strain CCMP 1326" /LENGTH=143 /DNA_ID=CAMNT_0017642587 /DNA_START=53 /DNA_END=481 /DNA_ORIENTATION=-